MSAAPLLFPDVPMQQRRNNTGRGLLGSSNDGGRPRDDFYPTPPEATEALLSAEEFHGAVWEPACGDGAISRVLEAAGLNVISTDLNDRGYGTPRRDFLLDPGQTVDSIVTNPPFGLAEPFVERALGFARHKVAMLLRLNFLEGQRRSRLVEDGPLVRVHVFRKRLQMFRNGDASTNSGMIAFAWFVWEIGFQGAPTLHWLPKRSRAR